MAPRARKHARPDEDPTLLEAEWPLIVEATFGSLVRARGIAREVSARFTRAVARRLTAETGRLVLRMPESDAAAFETTCATISRRLDGIETAPILPREIEDILTISTSERHKWLAGGRLRSAGIRTVRLKGRGKVTFHVYDPDYVRDLLDRDLPSIWREEDKVAAAENRRRAAGKAALTRAAKGKATRSRDDADEDDRPDGWDDFDAEGLLR